MLLALLTSPWLSRCWKTFSALDRPCTRALNVRPRSKQTSSDGLSVVLDSSHELCMLFRNLENQQSSMANPQLQGKLPRRVIEGGL